MTPEKFQDIVSFIIPTVNQVELVKKCVTSLIESNPTSLPYEIIVVDDGSTPEIQKSLVQALCNCKVLTAAKNAGFSATVNQGAAVSQGNYLCLVNNDISFIQKNWLDLMLVDARRPRVGLLGPRLLYPDGRIQHGGIIYLPQRGFDHEYRNQPGDYYPALRSREVLGVTGALMLINRRMWETLGGMDERFFIGMEDIDFSLRAWEKGWRIYYTGAAVAVHPEGFTRWNNPYWHSKAVESGMRFAQKWNRKIALFRQTPRITHGFSSISEEQAARWRKLSFQPKPVTVISRVKN
ncbi:MAG TPA: glycosyltransferase family 2 protein [Bacillota bacterium]|nr:glycosyltransferase family 2 protein [Bacillota bacterium]